MTKRELFNTVLVHTARTWERIRLEQPHEEMNEDNIESVDSIVEIADAIMEAKPLKKFLESSDFDWHLETGEDFSDTYIEGLATEIINNEYI